MAKRITPRTPPAKLDYTDCLKCINSEPHKIIGLITCNRTSNHQVTPQPNCKQNKVPCIYFKNK